eukprot:1901080-Rhodomonas_salina.3
MPGTNGTELWFLALDFAAESTDLALVVLILAQQPHQRPHRPHSQRRLAAAAPERHSRTWPRLCVWRGYPAHARAVGVGVRHQHLHLQHRCPALCPRLRPPFTPLALAGPAASTSFPALYNAPRFPPAFLLLFLFLQPLHCLLQPPQHLTAECQSRASHCKRGGR